MLEAFHRVFNVGADGDEHGRHRVALPILRRRLAHADRRHGQQRVIRQLDLFLQIAPQSTAAQGQCHIIYRSARDLVLHGPHVVQGEAFEADHAMAADRGVEAGFGHRCGLRQLLAHGIGQCRRCRGRCGEEFRDLQRPQQRVAPGADQQFPIIRHRVGAPLLGRRRHRRHLRSQVGQGQGHFQARGAVDGAVMGLEQQADAALRHPFQPVQAVDEVNLPWRAAHVQRAAENARGQRVERLPILGGGQADLANVILQIEARILDPIGMVQAERHVDQPPASGRHQVQAFLIEAHHRFQGQRPVRRRGRIEDGDRGHVHRRGRRVLVYEGGVLGAELLQHGTRLPGCRT